MIKVTLATPYGITVMSVPDDSLQAQIVAVEDGGTVTMSRDYTENIIFPLDKTVILDMNEYTLKPDTTDEDSSIVNTITVFGTAAISNGIISGEDAENARGVLVPNGGKLTLGEDTEVSGFKVKGSGAGIHVDGDGELELVGATVKDNTASESGGGIFIYDAAKLYVSKNPVISGNEATNGGGIAAYRMYTYVGGMNGLILENNKAEVGGGLYFGGIVDLTDTMTVSNITFRGNQAENGGGLYCYDLVTANFAGLKFENNTAASNGAAAYYKSTTVTNLINCEYTNNQALHGALYFAVASTVNFDGTTLSGNTATGSGGALYAAGTLQMQLKDVTIQNNSAYTYGGAFCLAAQKNQVTLLSGTISGNLAEKPRL